MWTSTKVLKKQQNLLTNPEFFIFHLRLIHLIKIPYTPVTFNSLIKEKKTYMLGEHELIDRHVSNKQDTQA